MDLGPLRDLALELSLVAHGVSATVTLPGPVVVETTGIWVGDASERQPYGGELARRDARRSLALPIGVGLDSIPRGATVSASERQGGAAMTWRVDGVERHDAYTVRVVLVRA